MSDSNAVEVFRVYWAICGYSREYDCGQAAGLSRAEHAKFNTSHIKLVGALQ